MCDEAKGCRRVPILLDRRGIFVEYVRVNRALESVSSVRICRYDSRAVM